MIVGRGGAGNAGEGGSSSSGRLLNEGFALVWVCKDPTAGTRPFLWALVLDSNQRQSREIEYGDVLFLRNKPGLGKVVL